MKRQSKIIFVIIAVLVVVIAGYYAYQKHDLNKRLQASDKILKAKGVKLNSTDKSITDKVLKDDNTLEYAYIKHNGNDVMLNLKFKDSIQEKDKYSKINKYLNEAKTYYKGKNVNVMSLVEWLVEPSYKGITTDIQGKIDTKKVASVKALVDGTSYNVIVGSDGTFSYDANAVSPGTTITIKAYDSNKNLVNLKDIVKGI